MNDAVVMPWQELKGVMEHTKEGLFNWMMEENKVGTEPCWEQEKLCRAGISVLESSPNGLWDYGPRLQFWIPTGERKMEVVNLVCVDVMGITGLTDGKEYQATIDDDLLYEVVDDNGQERSFFRSRFRRV